MPQGEDLFADHSSEFLGGRHPKETSRFSHTVFFGERDFRQLLFDSIELEHCRDHLPSLVEEHVLRCCQNAHLSPKRLVRSRER
ncbi:MAG TPA: hypothetical protein VE860_00025, partial [Chthoniobacterales bacterium]|nr:hypothetical protein [Chthoniobacterales bacterium]